MFLKKSKKAPPKYYIWVLLGIIVFGLILWLWQSWGAKLPEDPRQAVREVAEKMAKIRTVDLVIEHTLTAPYSADIAVEAVVEVELPSDYLGRMKITGPEVFMKELPFSAEQEFASLNGKKYTRDAGQAEWVDHSVNPEYVPFLNVEPLAFLNFSLDRGEVAREKDEQIGAENYAVYSFGYSQEAVGEAIKPLGLLIDEIPAEAEVRGKIWIDPRTRYLHKQQVEVMVPEIGGEKVETVFSDYGGLFLVSPFEKVVSATPSTTDPAQESAGQERAERNQKRQVDLLAIKAALEKIYDDDRVYPEAPEAVNLSNDQAEVHQKLLKYLKEVPADPQSPKYYYAYKCTGGEQYELTGIQESDSGDPKVIFLTQRFDYFEEKNR
mgnify:FL=1